MKKLFDKTSKTQETPITQEREATAEEIAYETEWCKKVTEIEICGDCLIVYCNGELVKTLHKNSLGFNFTIYKERHIFNNVIRHYRVANDNCIVNRCFYTRENAELYTKTLINWCNENIWLSQNNPLDKKD